MRIRQDRRGISNVIVFVLGLVIIVVIVSNVFLWNYEMNQLDWEKMQEDISIVNATSVIDTWSYNPSEYALYGSTSNVSGSISNLTSDDSVYMAFRSYSSGTGTSDFVDQTCDLYPPSAKGTHSNFAAQQAGPDSTYDTLTEENTATTSTPIQNMNFTSDLSSWTTDNALWENVGSPLSGAGSVRYRVSGGWQSGTAYCQQDFTVSSIPSSAVLSWYWKKSWGGSKTPATQTIWVELIYSATTKYSWTDTQIGNIGWTWQSVDVTSNIDSTGTWTLKLRWSLQTQGGGGNWVQANFDDMGIKLTSPTNYELDLEVQWTSADHDETNEELCIKTGTFSGSEDLQVKVRSGGSWVWVMNLTASQWNNVSVTSYLTGSTFTIQFLGGTEISDSTQDSWNIDVTLLHVWPDEYTAEVEFTGSSNTEDWTQLNWTINSAWTIGSVSVTLQLYNYTLDGYPTSGNGYMSYTSSATPNTDETKNQAIDSNPTNFRNATGYWKMKVKGVKATDTQFDFKADWVEFKAVKSGGTIFTFENEGSLTSRLVSLWITNSTQHQRYNMDLIINSAQTLNYTRTDITLPSGEYIAKVVTERGNTATYTGS